MRGLAILAFAFFASLSIAQTAVDLRLNGEHHATAPIGGVMQISMTTTPNKWGSLLFSLNPGPTTVFGTPIPIGIDATTIVSHQFLNTGPGGTFVAQVNLIDDLFWEGITYYAYGYTFDNSTPFGFGSSNQASVTFTRHVNAGQDTAGFVNEGITLDGGDLIAQGPLHSGLQISWMITNGPLGHAATLTGQDTAFPTLTADLPGTYDIQLDLGFAGTTGGSSDVVSVDVFELDVVAQPQGTFSTADPVSFSANLNGPAAPTFGLSGGTASATNSISGTSAAGTPATSFIYEATAGNGQNLGRGRTIINNMGGVLAAPPADSIVANFQQATLDQLEVILESALAGVDLSGPIPLAAPIPLISTFLFSATITPQTFSYDPNILIDMTFVANAINVQMTLNNVNFTFDVTGNIVFVPYMDTGMLTATSVVLDFDVIPTITNGVYSTTTANETATINGAALTFVNNIIPASQTGTILPLLVSSVENLLSTLIPPVLPPLIDTTLNAIPQSIDLSGSGVDITMNLVPTSLMIAPGEMSLGYGGGASANAIAPGAPILLGYYQTLNPKPTYGGTVPGTTTIYDFAASIGDDLINQLLAAATEAGSLNFDIDGSFDIGGTTVSANAAAFALIFPGAGFDRFDGASRIKATVTPTIAPLVTLDNLGGSDNYNLILADTELDIQVEVTPGYWASALRMGLGAQTGISITVNTATNTFDLTPGTTTATAYAITSMPGVNLTSSLTTLSGLINGVLPNLLIPITGIPLVTIPGTMSTPGVAAIQLDGAAGDYISLFLN